MLALRRLLGSGIIACAVMFGLLASSGSGAPPSSCNVGDLQLRSSTVNQGLGSYDRLVRGKETLVRLFLSLPSCAPSGASLQITGGTLTAKNGQTILASGITGTPTPVNVFPSVATYSTAALTDAPGDIKFVVPGSVLAPGGTTASFTASFRADLTYQYKASSNGTLVTGAMKTFDNFASKTVEKRTNALRILVVPMGNAANSYSSEFPASAVAAVENGMQTLSRIYPVPSGVGTLGGTTGGIRYAIDPTLLNVTTPYCGSGSNFDAIKAQLAQFLVSWNTANPTAQADRVVGAIASEKSLGGSAGCAEGMASLVSPEAWVRAFPDAADAPSMTGALFAMEIAHTFGLVPASRSYSTFHSLSTAADGTDPNRGYNVALRAFLADDHSTMKLSGAWNNNTTILEKADYAYLLCVLGGVTNAECTTPTVAGSATGVAALSVAYALTGHTDGTVDKTEAQESYVATELEGRGTDSSSPYKLVQLSANGAILQSTGVRVALAETIHEDANDPDHEDSGLGTFAVVAPLNASAQKFELRLGSLVLWSANKTLPPVITPGSFTVTPGGARNFTNTTAQSENDPALTSDAQWVAYEAGQGITVAPTDSVQSGVSVPLPELDNGSIGAVVYSETNKVHVITDPTGTPVDTVVFNGTVSGIGGIADPEFSPDLTRIVFAGVKDGNRDIFSINRFGGTPRRVTSDSRADVQPTWAKGRIIFVRQAGAGGTGDLFSVRPDGTDEVRLTNDGIADEGPTASPDGDQFAWQRPGTGWDIYVMNVDGTGMTNLTPSDADGNSLSPDWSADGSQIAFHLFFFPFGPNDTDVYTVGVDGGSPINVTATSGKPETNPLWAGDASALLYQTGGSFETISLEGSGGTVTPVSIAGASDWAVVRPTFASPAWGGQTGDGAHLAYVFGGNLFTVPVDLSQGAPVFGEPVQIWSNSDGDEFIARSPTISNDDSTVVFLVDEYEDDLFYGVVTEDESYSFVDDGDNTGPYQAASFAHGGTDGEALAVQIPAFGGLPEIWTSAFDTSGTGCPCVNFGTDPVISEGHAPSEGTDGRIAFGRDGDVWVWTPPEIEGPGTEEMVFENGANAALAGDTYAFERGIGTDEFPPDDIFIGSPGSGIDINVTVEDDNAEDNRLDLLVDCPGLTYVGAVALLPSEVQGESASWAANFDPSLTCENPELRVAISDGYNRVLSGDTGQEVEAEQKGPTAAIYTPPVGSTFREYDVVPARGSGWDAEDGTLPNANLDWTLERDGGGYSVTGEGPNVDFSPPANGFPLGDYTLTLKVADSAGNEDTATRTFTIVEDADNDGLTAAEEAQGCVTNDPTFVEPPAYEPDQDPLNSFRDGDLDGIPNIDDPAACTAATVYEAIVDVDADMVKSQPLGVITGFVKLRYRPITAVNGATVRISSINGISTGPNGIPSLRWSIDKNGVGISKFDKMAVINFMNAHDIGDGYALITIRGSSFGNTWTFEGSDLTNVH